jgi:hypothetical protein
VGYFQSPSIQRAARQALEAVEEYLAARPLTFSECVPCYCNGHGDTCNIWTGEGCICRDNTITNSGKCEPNAYGSCWHVQCAECATEIELSDLRFDLRGTPVNGRFCYASLAGNVEVLAEIFPRETANFEVTAGITNVGIRLSIMRDQALNGRLRLVLTKSNNITVDKASGALVGNAPLLTDRVFDGTVTQVISSDGHNFLLDRFFVTVYNPTDTTMSFAFIFSQPLVGINLFVFFSVFFSAFFLFFAMIVLFAKFRADYERAVMSQQEQVQLEVRAGVGVGMGDSGDGEVGGGVGSGLPLLTKLANCSPTPRFPLSGNGEPAHGRHYCAARPFSHIWAGGAACSCCYF